MYYISSFLFRIYLRVKEKFSSKVAWFTASSKRHFHFRLSGKWLREAAGEQFDFFQREPKIGKKKIYDSSSWTYLSNTHTKLRSLLSILVWQFRIMIKLRKLHIWWHHPEYIDVVCVLLWSLVMVHRSVEIHLGAEKKNLTRFCSEHSQC